MKETERLYQLLTPFQANVRSFPLALKVLTVYTESLEGSRYVTKSFLMC